MTKFYEDLKMTQILRVVARVVALPNQVEALKAVLLRLVEPTRQEAGCLQYDLLQNQEDPTDFTFVETWNSTYQLARRRDHDGGTSSSLQGVTGAGSITG